MKNKKFLIIILIAALTFTQCGKEWLELEPQGKQLDIGYYTTDEAISKGLVAAYDMLQTKYLPGFCSWYFLASFPGDDSWAGGDGPRDQPGYQESDLFTLTPSSVNVDDLWRLLYYGVYRANIVIVNAKPTDANTRAMIAEAKFLHAFYYYELVNFYGRVPLITELVDSYDLPNNEIDEVLTYIVSELNAAVPDLLNRSALQFPERYRATKAAALTLLGKIYLMQEDWANAKVVLNDAAFNEYDLEPNFKDIWSVTHEYGIESIFEVSFTNAMPQAGDWGDGRNNYGNIDVQMSGYRGLAGTNLNSGWGFDLIDPRLRQAFNDEKDWVRKEGTMYSRFYVSDVDSGSVQNSQHAHMSPKYEAYGDPMNPVDSLFLDSMYFSYKRACWNTYTNGTDAVWNYTTNERVFRLADVKLMLAEAEFNLGNVGAAADLVNEVRDRVDLAPKSTVTYDDIKLERRLELAMEGQRYFDLQRWGDAATALAKDGYIVGRSEYFPIPQGEIENTHGALQQNPGY